MLLIWGGVNFWLDRRRKKNETALVEGVTAVQADPSVAASAEEVAAMRDKLTTALALLKKASGSRGYLYEQPWYAIIGPPGRRQDHSPAERRTVLSRLPPRWARARSPASAAPACATGGSPTTRGADRYRRPLHHAGLRRGGRSSAGWQAFLGLLKRTRAASAAERRDRSRSRCPISPLLPPPNDWPTHAPSAVASRNSTTSLAFACRSTRCSPRPTSSPASRSSSTIWIARSAPRSGASTFPLNKTEAGTAGRFGAEFRAAGGAPQPAPARSFAGRTQPGSARADRRLPRPGRQPRRAAAENS